jgi:hypothetical protein
MTRDSGVVALAMAQVEGSGRGSFPAQIKLNCEPLMLRRTKGLPVTLIPPDLRQECTQFASIFLIFARSREILRRSCQLGSSPMGGDIGAFATVFRAGIASSAALLL